MIRKTTLRAALLVSALLSASISFPSTAQHTITAASTPVPHQACCGLITEQGYRLAAVIDSMNVEQRWLIHQHINWETGESDRPAGYTGHDMATHCSAFAAAVGERLNVYMLRPPDHPQTFLASAQAEWFHGSDGTGKGWKPLTGEGHEQRAQELANQGILVVIVYESPVANKPGHIAIVRPSEKSAADLHIEGPQIAQAGTENHSDSIAALSFTHHPGAWPDGVRYYWHPVDWAAVPLNLTIEPAKK